MAVPGFLKNNVLARLPWRHDIQGMKRSLICCCVVILALSGGGAFAQPIPPGSPPYLPPPPPPPPPPKIEVPPIPKMDELPKRSYAPIAPQKSFGDRATKCLDDAAASGLGPNERSTYSRNCATR